MRASIFKNSAVAHCAALLAAGILIPNLRADEVVVLIN